MRMLVTVSRLGFQCPVASSAPSSSAHICIFYDFEFARGSPQVSDRLHPKELSRTAVNITESETRIRTPRTLWRRESVWPVTVRRYLLNAVSQLASIIFPREDK
jgi:hypothetical protein